MTKEQERFYVLCTAYGAVNIADKALRDAATFADDDDDLQKKAVECVRFVTALREAIGVRIRSRV